MGDFQVLLCSNCEEQAKCVHPNWRSEGLKVVCSMLLSKSSCNEPALELGNISWFSLDSKHPFRADQISSFRTNVLFPGAICNKRINFFSHPCGPLFSVLT